MAVVVQRLVVPTYAGVLFTSDPVSGADVRVIEASWGLGEAVVAGLVTPDRYRLARDGAILEAVSGLKDVMLEPAPDGGTEEVDVAPERIAALSLQSGHLAALNALAAACEATWPGAHDLEWAIAGEELFLRQRRPITRLVD